MKLGVKSSLIIQGVFFLGIQVSVNGIVSIYDSPNDVSDEELFQLSEVTSCLFTKSKTCMVPTALGFPEDMSHHSILILEIQDFY